MFDPEEFSHAAALYEGEKVSPKRAREIIDAFLAKGFVLRDIGGGDIVWTRELYATARARDPLLTLEISDAVGGIINDLRRPVMLQVRGPDEGGFYVMGRSARELLDTYGDFNVVSKD